MLASSLITTPDGRPVYVLAALTAAYILFVGHFLLRRRNLLSVAMAIVILAALSAAAVTVESATRSLARTEAQRAADAAALAVGGVLIADPRDEAGARATAIEFARMNRVRGRAPQIGAQDVLIDVEAGTVRVRVRSRAYGIPAPIAWFLGADRVSVSAEATAEGAAARMDGRPAFPRRLKLVR